MSMPIRIPMPMAIQNPNQHIHPTLANLIVVRIH